MASNLWTRYLERLSSRRLGRRRCRVVRRWGNVGPAQVLESRLLLAADVQAQVFGGTLYLNGFAAGNRDLTVSQDVVNPALLDITPGAGTTVNGAAATLQLPTSQIFFGINVSLNNGFGTTGTTRFQYTSSTFVLPGNLSVSLSGNGADTVGIGVGSISGSLFVTTGSNSDTVTLSSLHVGGFTSIYTGQGHDTVTVQSSTFGPSFYLDGGLGGGDTLNIDDSTFNGSFAAIMWSPGNTINVEQNPALLGQTTFNGPAYFEFLGALTPGSGGRIHLGTEGTGSRTVFHSISLFLGASMTVASTVDFGSFAPILIGTTRTEAIAITTTTLPNWTVNQPGYTATIATTNGVAPLNFSISAGTLPTGLAINATTGVISGTPTVAGTSPFTVRVQDSVGAVAYHSYSVTINSAVAITTTSPLPNATEGGPYSTTIVATGGTGARTFSLASGSLPLPSGLVLNATTGVISGTLGAGTTGDHSFRIHVQDITGAFAEQDFALHVNAPITFETTSPLPETTVGATYSQTIVATGGTGALSYALAPTSLPLPGGLALSSGGVLSGSPTTAATSTFTVRATDVNGAFTDQAYELTVNPAPTFTTTSPLPSGTVGATYSETIAATGGTGMLSFSLASGSSLPAGLTFASSGLLFGVPDVGTDGTHSFTIDVTDSASVTVSMLFELTINVA